MTAYVKEILNAKVHVKLYKLGIFDWFSNQQNLKEENLIFEGTGLNAGLEVHATTE